LSKFIFNDSTNLLLLKVNSIHHYHVSSWSYYLGVSFTKTNAVICDKCLVYIVNDESQNQSKNKKLVNSLLEID